MKFFGLVWSLSLGLLLGSRPATPASLAAVDGAKLRDLINCFAWYLPDAAFRPDNSATRGCNVSDIRYCKTDSGHNDHFCLFTGSNVLTDSYGAPSCFFNCQMETCNAWAVPHSEHEQQCIDNL